MARITDIFIVIGPGPLVINAYTNKIIAELHATTMTGLAVVPCELHEQLPESVRTDIMHGEFDDNDTPEVQMNVEDFDDQLKK